jgi:hypothetical protein
MFRITSRFEHDGVPVVIPAQTGNQSARENWVTACAGMT